jgi:uncharacterized membrane protein YwaF
MGIVVLVLQIFVRTALTGPTRQYIEEILWPFPLFLSFLLLYLSVVAFIRRERRLGTLGILVSIISALIALMPILLNEAIYD